jgi:hypothetical protein
MRLQRIEMHDLVHHEADDLMSALAVVGRGFRKTSSSHFVLCDNAHKQIMFPTMLINVFHSSTTLAGD